MDRFQYLALMALCLLVTLPLEFVFQARVWRRPRRLVRAVWPPLVVFLVWDVVAIARGHWRFNPRYVTGWRLPLHLPVEELAFFVVIPLCALLTYEAVRHLLEPLKPGENRPDGKTTKWSDPGEAIRQQAPSRVKR